MSHELMREWTAEEAAENGVAGQDVTPRVSRRGEPVSAAELRVDAAATAADERSGPAGAPEGAGGADHLAGIAPAFEDPRPGLPSDPPSQSGDETEVTS
jgi:hypothetical protein